MKAFFQLLFFFLLLSVPLKSQTLELSIVDSLAIPARFFTVDRLQQIYAVDSVGLLTKYSPEGKALFEYSNRPYGPLARVDATDPFNLMLYYPEYQTVLLLDRTLSPTAELNLTTLGLIDVQQVAMGNDLHMWLYDQAAFKLYKMNPEGRISLQSGDLSLVLARPPQATRLTVQNNVVWLYDPAQGLHQFDIFGQYLRTLDFKDRAQIQVLDGRLFYLESPDLMGVYDLKSFRASSLTLPQAAEGFQWQKGRLFLLGDGKIWVLRW